MAPFTAPRNEPNATVSDDEAVVAGVGANSRRIGEEFAAITHAQVRFNPGLCFCFSSEATYYSILL